MPLTEESSNTIVEWSLWTVVPIAVVLVVINFFFVYLGVKYCRSRKSEVRNDLDNTVYQVPLVKNPVLYLSVSTQESSIYENDLRSTQLLLTRQNFPQDQDKFKKIGSGYYSDVYKVSVFPASSNKKQVQSAVKLLKDASGLEEFKNESLLLAEAQKKQNNFVIAMIGVYLPSSTGFTDSGILSKRMLVTEFMQKGDVRSFLKALKTNVSQPLLSKWCHELVEAVVFIKDLGIVHRDIAARN